MYSTDESLPAEQPTDSTDAGPANNDPIQRLHDRLLTDSVIHLCWQERRGVQRTIRARAVDVSKFGILVEAESAIAGGTIISVQSKNFTMIGRASVRHCTPKGLNFRIGLYMPDRLLRDL